MRPPFSTILEMYPTDAWCDPSMYLSTHAALHGYLVPMNWGMLTRDKMETYTQQHTRCSI